MKIYLSNSLTKTKDLFEPIDLKNIKMYACGPTVYDRAHLGNARSAVTYDILFRFLRSIYSSVNYARNITDVDDKIIKACLDNDTDFLQLTQLMTKYYHDDMKALNCLSPTHEPKATEYIPQMIDMIETLISKNHAYVSNNHVLFSIDSFKEYGKLANRSQEDMIAGARVEVAPYKKNPADFVLWKPSTLVEEAFGFDSPWGRGRPGWHIECSAMTRSILGENFDIHGGGVDLIFPHHENEVAQSKCSSEKNQFANYWVHNGFLMVNGEKMSKSLGNFKTVKEVLDEGVEGCAIRCFYLSTHYKKPIDFNDKAIEDAAKAVARFRTALKDFELSSNFKPDNEFLEYLADDINTPLYLSKMHEYASKYLSTHDKQYQSKLAYACDLIGLNLSLKVSKIPNKILALVEQRLIAKNNKDWVLADKLRSQIEQAGYIIKDSKTDYKLEKKV